MLNIHFSGDKDSLSTPMLYLVAFGFILLQLSIAAYICSLIVKNV